MPTPPKYKGGRTGFDRTVDAGQNRSARKNQTSEDRCAPVPALSSGLPPIPPVDPEKVARQRFFALGLFRLSGALLVMFGFLILMQRFHWVQGNKAKAMGAIFVVVGLFQFVIVPRLLLALFRRPPQS